MNLTTISISGLALALFAVAIAVRATERAPGDARGWRHLPPAPAAAPAPSPVDEADANSDRRALERAAEQTSRKDARARREAAEALDVMRHARHRLGASRGDDVARTYWDSQRRTATVRLESACCERRRALDALHAMRAAYAIEAPHDR